MKHLYVMILFICFFACNEKRSSDTPSQTTEKEKVLTLKGVWEMVGYYNFVNNKVADSFKTQDDFKQIKIYTDHKVMWSKSVPMDDTEWFGYGHYSFKDGELTEVLEYGSEMMRRIVQEKKEFKYELILEKNKFSQIEVDENGNRLYSENYIRIE